MYNAMSISKEKRANVNKMESMFCRFVVSQMHTTRVIVIVTNLPTIMFCFPTLPIEEIYFPLPYLQREIKFKLSNFFHTAVYIKLK